MIIKAFFSLFSSQLVIQTLIFRHWYYGIFALSYINQHQLWPKEIIIRKASFSLFSKSTVNPNLNFQTRILPPLRKIKHCLPDRGRCPGAGVPGKHNQTARGGDPAGSLLAQSGAETFEFQSSQEFGQSADLASD